MNPPSEQPPPSRPDLARAGHVAPDFWPAAQAPGWAHPGLARYADDAARLGGPGPDWIDRADHLAQARGLTSCCGAPIRFVADHRAPAVAVDALGYERSIYESGRVACRVTGPGARHDLHNALVWLRWPRLKAAINRGHVLSPDAVHAPAGARSRRRDALTLLDESGLVWVSRDPALDQRLRDRAWAPLLSARRDAVMASVQACIVGHGLLEKLHHPYRAMTAQVLVVAAEGGPAVGPTDGHGDPLDAWVAAALDRLLQAGELAPSALCPLPVLGLPGWDPANADPSYYADTRVFRPAPVVSATDDARGGLGCTPRTRR
jgi:hypothetical protein